MVWKVNWSCCISCQVQRALPVPVVCASCADDAAGGLGDADAAQGEGGRAGAAVAAEDSDGLPRGQPSVLRPGGWGDRWGWGVRRDGRIDKV